jgi:PleD family two-component response regulator
MNLVINASEAIGHTDGTIRLATRQDGRFVPIEVADTGCGMDAETRARIFDTFFTTKQAGRGRGLSVVQTIVHNHNGSIEVEDRAGRGTIFRILLPSAMAPPTEDPAGAESVPGSTVKGTIVLVEDEPTLLLSVSRMLRKRRFSTLEASDGSAAIGLLQDQGNPIDVMVLDMNIPGKSQLRGAWGSPAAPASRQGNS